LNADVLMINTVLFLQHLTWCLAHRFQKIFVICDSADGINQVWQTFSMKSYIVNILGFMDHVISVTVSQLLQY
jgi:hypothetical protein